MRRISTESPQDLLTRTWTRSCNDTGRISPGHVQELLTRTWTGQDHAKAWDSMSLGSPQDLRTRNCKNLGQDLHARIPKRISQDHQKRPAPQPCKDLLERTLPGSPQDLLFRTCKGSRKDLLKRKLAGSPQEPDYARIDNENAVISMFALTTYVARQFPHRRKVRRSKMTTHSLTTSRPLKEQASSNEVWWQTFSHCAPSSPWISLWVSGGASMSPLALSSLSVISLAP